MGGGVVNENDGFGEGIFTQRRNSVPRAGERNEEPYGFLCVLSLRSLRRCVNLL